MMNDESLFFHHSAFIIFLSFMLTAVVANKDGSIFDLEGYGAVGMAGNQLIPLTSGNTINIPYGGELMFLPDRMPIVYNFKKKKFETLSENPFIPGEPIFPVAAFNSPGYVCTCISAYKEKDQAAWLPLFSYGAIGWHHGKFKTPLVLVDTEKRQDIRLMKQEKIVAGVRRMRTIMPKNRLREHLEKCALIYGCPAGKNFFLRRYEAPLPTSPNCNARCLGCISLQQNTGIPNCQERITFKPGADEIAQLALEHIKNVKMSVVSFGQGCEGEPLLAADVIEPAIHKIRSITSDGTINMNTNGSLPRIIEKLFDAGLDSVRISLNSVRESCYNAYFRPKSYQFSDVIKSIDTGINKGKFVSINYLNSPGFTDTPEEFQALSDFLYTHPIHMIQWRNLNFDPVRYWNVMNSISEHGKPIGMKTVLKNIRRLFPNLKFGYFNPPKEKKYL